jgi:hypothetical protein
MPQATINISFIGVGFRGVNYLNNALLIKDTEISAICDVDASRIDLSLKMIDKSGFKKAESIW